VATLCAHIAHVLSTADARRPGPCGGAGGTALLAQGLLTHHDAQRCPRERNANGHIRRLGSRKERITGAELGTPKKGTAAHFLSLPGGDSFWL